ncbi:hypothetical protein [Ferrimonas aestuarii]|uniref:PQ loop repeat-containing protein n=1 Tax=Ferrimonas aestuarii TaxID=2569539 RepID=A0A4U1BMQ1_9GAMM|nr:hypothetical protein [Ferrimonas aestuarii]TKB54939.1 hypothetical protein FCL42_10245 [Ferrimonas aestuarii]
MTLLDLAGSLHSLLTLVSLVGVWAQLRTIYQRRAQGQEGSQLLSLNQFSVGFFGYWSFFVYGFSLSPANHYLIWPRLTAALLMVAIIFNIHRDRRTSASLTMTIMTVACTLASLGAFAFGGAYIEDGGRWIATGLLLTISALLAQGYWHQIKQVIRHKQVGAINPRMSQLILAMDASTLLLVFAMGWQQGWPLAILASTSALTKIVLLRYYYRYSTAPSPTEKNGIHP